MTRWIDVPVLCESSRLDFNARKTIDVTLMDASLEKVVMIVSLQ